MPSALILSVGVASASAYGLLLSVRMLRKSFELKLRRHEDSVVALPDAQLFFRVPNSALGACYYAALLLTAFRLPHETWILHLTLVAALFALMTSLYLGARLLFVLRRACSMCWTSHALNALLAVAILFMEIRH